MPTQKYTKEQLKNASLIELAEIIIQVMPQLAIYNEQLYCFNGKYYELFTKTEIGQIIFDFFKQHAPKLYTPKRTADITYTLKFHPSIKRVKEFDNYDNLINLNNKVLNLDTKETFPHSPDYLFTTAIDVDYDPNNIKAPFFMKTLKDIFRIDKDNTDDATIMNILQLGGYLIYPKVKMNKLFLFFGEGSNGKGIIMYTYQLFFDDKFVSGLSLNVLSQESSFARKSLITSRVNFATEQKAGNVESDELKKISAGEHISIDRKHEDTIIHRVKTKILVSLNKLAKFKDVSYGMKRRLFIIKFKNRFEEPDKYKKYPNPEVLGIYPQGNEDEIKKQIKKEKSAILNLFLKALDELKTNNWKFIETKNSKEVFGEYNEEADPTGNWLEKNYEVDYKQTTATKLNDIFFEYEAWYENNYNDKKYMVSKRMFSKRIKDLFRVEAFTTSYVDPIRHINTSGTAFYIKKIEPEICETEKNMTNFAKSSKSPQYGPTQPSFPTPINE